MKSSTVMGQVNLWDNKEIEIIESTFDSLKFGMTLKFQLRDHLGQVYSIDKLKIYGVKFYDETSRTFKTIKKSVKSIDLMKEKKLDCTADREFLYYR